MAAGYISVSWSGLDLASRYDLDFRGDLDTGVGSQPAAPGHAFKGFKLTTNFRSVPISHNSNQTILP